MKDVQVGYIVSHPHITTAIGTVKEISLDGADISWKFFVDGRVVVYHYNTEALSIYNITPPMPLEEQVADLLG